MLDGFVDDFLVAVEREVVVVGGDVGLWHEEALVGAGAFGFRSAVLPTLKDVGQVGLVGLWAALVVERVAIGLHVVEPDMVGAAGVGFGEEEDGGGDTGIGLEDAGGHGDDGVEFLLLDKGLAELLVGIGRAEEDSIGHDDGGAATGLQEAQEERHEEEFGFFGFDDLEEVFGGGLVIEATGEGRIGEDEGVFFRIVLIALGEGVLVADVGVLDAVEEHVHAADAQHGGIEVVAVEGVLIEAAAAGGVLVDGVAVMIDQIFGDCDVEPASAAGRIAEDILRCGGDHFHHQLDDVSRTAELAVLTGGGDLSKHVLVEVAFGVAVGHVDVVELVDDVGEHARGGHHEGGILHVVAVGTAAFAAGRLADGLDEGEGVVPDGGKHLLRRGFLEAGPAEVILCGGEDGLLDGGLESGRFVLLEGVEFVQPLDEEQVGELLDDGEGVGDAAGPEGVPDAVDFGFDFASDHWMGACLAHGILNVDAGMRKLNPVSGALNREKRCR